MARKISYLCTVSLSGLWIETKNKLLLLQSPR